MGGNGGGIQAELLKYSNPVSAIDQLEVSLHVSIPLREFANNEFLCEVGTNAFRGSDCEISKQKSDPTIGLRIIKMREGRRREISSYARVVRLPFSVIGSRNERADYCVPDPRAGRASSLEEVTRILMEQRR